MGDSQEVCAKTDNTIDWNQLRRQYREECFCIVDHSTDDFMLKELRAAAQRVTDKTRTGEWKFRRGVNKPFPPYSDENDDTWGANMIMHPDLGEQALFLQWLS